jgi:penicillin-binding protein 1C
VQRTNEGRTPVVKLEVRGMQGEVNWLVNGRFVARASAVSGYPIRFEAPGRYDITAFDDDGKYDRVSVSVRGLP